MPRSKLEDGTPNPVDIHVGERLKSRRVLLNISQEKLADSTGITFQQIQKYERGANRVSASRLWQFSKILNVPVSYFFEDYSERKNKKSFAYGLSDVPQDTFTGGKDLMHRKETVDLIREYYSIPDPKMRRGLLKMIKTMAATMSSADDDSDEE